MVFDIKNKFAVITGGATGIGLAYAKELLRNGLKGVTIADIDSSKGEVAICQIAQEFGNGRAIFVKTDVTKPDQLEAVFKTSMNTWKSLDIVINNAGIMNDGHWELQININCNAVVRGTLLAFEYMGKDKGGKGGVVVNIASILGLQLLSGCPIYVGTKHFVVGLNRSFGTPFYFNRTGIKVLTMCPGVTDTPLISEAGSHALTQTGDVGKQLALELGALPPQRPENVAQGLITMITKGENGSVWVSEGGEPIYQVDIPDRRTIRKQ